MGELINLNPNVPITDADIPVAIARDAEYIAADAAHASASDPHPNYFAAINDLVAEGSFSPDIVGMTTQGVANYTFRTGSFTRIANTIFFRLRLGWTAHTGTGFAKITGLPFGNRSQFNPATISHSEYTLSANNILVASTGLVGTAEILLSQVPVGGGNSSSVLLDTAAQITISGSYLRLV